MSKKRLALGKRGEELAVDHLRKKKYLISHTNYRCRLGEIDIIAKKKKYLVFVEVKTRRGDDFGSPKAAVTYRKQQQISRVAQHFITENDLSESDARFDVVSVTFDTNDKHTIEHIENAFEFAG